LYFLPAALRAAQICRYLVYSEADFEVFGPQGRHVAPMGVKFGMEEGTFGVLEPRQVEISLFPLAIGFHNSLYYRTSRDVYEHWNQFLFL